MSLSGALSSALSGLNATSRAAGLVSSNIANAMTDGYGRRELVLQARHLGAAGQGVTVRGVQRHGDPVLTGDRRVAQAGAANRDLQATFLRDLEAIIGTPETAGSLGQRIADLETALIEASSRPESDARLTAIADAAQGLTSGLADMTHRVQEARATADHRIAAEVDSLNSGLRAVADLNRAILSLGAQGHDTSALQDQRQAAIDRIAGIVPLREVPRDNGQVALFTTGGAVLLDGRAAQLGFVPAGIVVPAMTAAAGGLSGLTLHGRPVAMPAEGGSFGGGSLSALFAIRDDLAPAAQARLDAVARDLVERTADPGVDPTLPTGAPGLFTDGGHSFDPAHETGLAGRLALNPAADPAAGGALWRLRDGMGATAPGPSGQSALLTALSDALTRPRTTLSGGLSDGQRSLAGLAADVLSVTSTRRVAADGEASYLAARHTALRELELAGGIDTDQEMQSLLLIEQGFAANAKVIQSVDAMIQTLLGL